LVRVTDDPVSVGFLSVNNGWAVWQTELYFNGTLAGGITVANLTTGELFPIVASPGMIASGPVISNGRIVFDGGGLFSWNVWNRKIQPVETGFSGGLVAHSLDGDWLTFGGQNTGGNWAMNLASHRKVHIPPGDGAALTSGGKAYWIRDANWQLESGFNATVYELDLETGVQRQFVLENHHIRDFAVGSRYFAFVNDHEVWALNLVEGIFSRVSESCELCSRPSTAGPWIVYLAADFTAKAVNMETGQPITYGAHDGMPILLPNTDGKTVILDGHMGDGYRPFYDDVFYATLPA
jgi:hypothetical protein